MELVETGTICEGAIALDHPLPLHDGAKVVVRIAEVGEPATPQKLTEAEFQSLEFIGEWADRIDLGTSEDYVAQERAKWSRRSESLD